MADVRLNVQKSKQHAITPTYESAALNTSDTFLVRNSGRVFLHFKKTGAGVCTVTIQTPVEVSGLAVAELTFTVPATTGDKIAGPFTPNLVNDKNGDLRFTLNETTGLSVAVIQL